MIGKIQSFIQNPTLREAVRLDPKAFTRDRTLTFPILINFILSGLTASVQQELDSFFPHLDNKADFARTVTAQAFSEARMKLSANVFKKINDFLLLQLAQYVTLPLWHGLRLVAADGSKLAMASRDATGRNAINAMAFALYLPGSEMTLAYELYHADACERQMLFEHLDLLSSRDLLLLDRGYPATWLIAALLQRGIHFCMRVDQSGYAAVKEFVRSGEAERIVTLKPASHAAGKTYEIERTESTVRLVRCVTPDGQIRVLMTSLRDVASYPAGDFAALYHQRWRIEECFKRLKHRLGLEAVSGCSWLTAQQDFGAKIVCDNLNAICVLAAAPDNEQIDLSISQRKINRTAAFPALKRCLPRCLLGLAENIAATLKDALNLIAKTCNISFQAQQNRAPKAQSRTENNLTSDERCGLTLEDWLKSPLETRRSEEQAGRGFGKGARQRANPARRRLDCPQRRGLRVSWGGLLWLRFLATQERKVQRDARTKIKVPKALKRPF